MNLMAFVCTWKEVSLMPACMCASPNTCSLSGKSLKEIKFQGEVCARMGRTMCIWHFNLNYAMKLIDVRFRFLGANLIWSHRYGWHPHSNSRKIAAQCGHDLIWFDFSFTNIHQIKYTCFFDALVPDVVLPDRQKKTWAFNYLTHLLLPTPLIWQDLNASRMPRSSDMVKVAGRAWAVKRGLLKSVVRVPGHFIPLLDGVNVWLRASGNTC